MLCNQAAQQECGPEIPEKALKPYGPPDEIVIRCIAAGLGHSWQAGDGPIPE